MDGKKSPETQTSTAIQPTSSAAAPKPPPVPTPSAKSVSSSPQPVRSSIFADITQACPKQSQWVLAILLAIAGMLLAIHAYGFLPFSTRPTKLIPGEMLTYRPDLNQASAAELMQVPGIGPTLANRIVEYREKYGKFGSIDELDNIDGIGPTTLQRLRDWVCIDEKVPFGQVAKLAANKQGKPPAAAGNVQRPKDKTPWWMQPKEPFQWTGPPLNVNSASAEELDKLPDIGPVLSQRIVEERQKSPFISVDDLQRVDRIGPKTVEKVRPYVTVGK